MAVEEVYRHPEDYDLELSVTHEGDEQFWCDLVRREHPTRVLEVGCGTGRLTLPLARDGAARGWTVLGLDPEPAMLSRAEELRRAEPAAVQAAVRFIRDDVRTLQLNEAFDVIVMPYGIAHHLTDLDDQIVAWSTLRRHLRPSALLAIDVGAPNLDSLAQAVPGAPRAVDLDVTDAQGDHLRRSDALRYSPATQRALHMYHYERQAPDGSRHRYRSPCAMHIYYPRELVLLCRLTGFYVEKMLGSYRGEPFADNSPLMIALARAI